jgi:hypothetical protein
MGELYKKLLDPLPARKVQKIRDRETMIVCVSDKPSWGQII